MIPIPRAGIYQGVSGIEQARGVPAVEDVIITAKQGQRLLPLPEGASYLGFIFARGDTPAQAEAALRQAHAALRFEVATELATIRPLPSAARSPAAGRRPPRKSIDPSG